MCPADPTPRSAEPVCFPILPARRFPAPVTRPTEYFLSQGLPGSQTSTDPLTPPLQCRRSKCSIPARLTRLHLTESALMPTQTWNKRLTTSGGLARKAAMIVALSSCTIVAMSNDLGLMFGAPVDVSTRPAVSSTGRCWSEPSPRTAWAAVDRQSRPTAQPGELLADQRPDPTADHAGRHRRYPRRLGGHTPRRSRRLQQWSVVVSVSERPYASASHDWPATDCRSSTAATACAPPCGPALVNCPGPRRRRAGLPGHRRGGLRSLFHRQRIRPAT